MNFSNSSINCQDTLAPVSLSYFSLVTCFLLCLCIVPGNTMVCLAVLKDPNRNLRSHFTLLIANLAMADLIAGLVTQPSAIAYILLELQGSHPPEFLVYTTHLSYFISVQASVLTLVGLTSDRYLAITKPLWYRATVNPANATLISCLVWACAVGFSLVYLRVGFTLYSFIFANTAVIFALIVLIFTYVRIFKAIHARVDEVLSLDASSPDRDKQQREALWEKKLTKTYLLMLVCFMACYVPSCSFIYTQHFCFSCTCDTIHWLRDLQFNSVIVSSALNPFLYAWRLANFRRAFIDMVRCDTKPWRGSGKIESTSKETDSSEVIAMAPICGVFAEGVATMNLAKS